MRTLKHLPTPAPAPERDEGAVLVLVALIMVALIGVGAFVVDLGALYVEKRQLQNGADAAALAVAQDCANGDCGNEAATAQQYANLNAKDDMSAVDLVCGKDPGLTPCAAPAPAGAANATGWVRVATSTQTSSGNQVDFVLGPVMNSITGATVRASAVAAWGALGSATTLRFIISECEFQQMGGNLGTGTFPTGTSYIYSKKGNAKDDKNNDPPCVSSSSGGTISGNFAWLDAVRHRPVQGDGVVGWHGGRQPWKRSGDQQAGVCAGVRSHEGRRRVRDAGLQQGRQPRATGPLHGRRLRRVPVHGLAAQRQHLADRVQLSGPVHRGPGERRPPLLPRGVHEGRRRNG